MQNWITDWVWGSKGRRETILVIDDDTGAFVGFGTWRHREVPLPWGTERAITIEWFGVDVRYQGQRTEAGYSVATTLFETLESKAREHELSTDDMPLFLEVDVDNEDAQGFWEHLGFEFLESVEVLQRGRYRRMLRSASADDEVP